MKKLWRVDEIAFYLDVSERTVRRLIKRGLLPAKRVGKQLRVDDADLCAFLERYSLRGNLGKVLDT